MELSQATCKVPFFIKAGMQFSLMASTRSRVVRPGCLTKNGGRLAFIKHSFNPLFSLLARACERSNIAARVISKVHFRGKGCIVERIRSDAMPKEVVATCGRVK